MYTENLTREYGGILVCYHHLGKNGVPLVNEIAQWIHSFYPGSYSCLASFPSYPQILSHSHGKKSAPIFLHSCEIKSGSGLGTRLTVGSLSTQLHVSMG